MGQEEARPEPDLRGAVVNDGAAEPLNVDSVRKTAPLAQRSLGEPTEDVDARRFVLDVAHLRFVRRSVRGLPLILSSDSWAEAFPMGVPMGLALSDGR